MQLMFPLSHGQSCAVGDSAGFLFQLNAAEADFADA